jgi:hypothetical protein
MSVVGRNSSEIGGPLILCMNCFGNACKFRKMHNRRKSYEFNYDDYTYHEGRLYTIKEFREVMKKDRELR